MTTPDTSAVRSWARDNGFDVADRGRLPTEVVDAYTARRKSSATGRSVQAPSSKPAGGKAAVAKPADKAKPAVAKPAGKAKPAAAKTPPRAAKAATPAKTATPPAQAPAAAVTRRPRTAPRPTPRTGSRPAAAAPADDATSAFADASLQAITTDPPVPHTSAGADDRLAQLAAQVRALTDRVTALEGDSAKPGKSRFRRQR